MKTILSLTFMVMLCTSLNAQQTFTNTYGTATDEYFSDLSVQNSNSLIVATNKNADVFAMAADKDGKLIWSKNLGTSYIESNVHCTITSDNSILLFLQRWIDSGTPAEGAVLIKCNKNGDIIWSKSIRSKKYKYIQPVAVMENADKSIMLLYGKNNAWNDTNFIALSKFTGTTLNWETTIYLKNKLSYNAQSLTKNGDSFIIGAMQNNETTDQDVPALFYINSNGTVQYAKDVYDPFFDFSANHSYLQNVFQRNGKTTLVGYYYGDNANESYFIMNLKPTDSIVTANFISHDIFSLQYYMKRTKTVATNQKLLNNVFLDQYYSLQVASSSVYTGQRNNLFLSKYDSAGRICPFYTLPAVDSSVTKHNYTLMDDSYSLINDKVYLDTVSFTIKNAGSETDLCSGEALQKPIAEKINISVSPNPAKNFIMVDFILSKTSTVQFDISSSTGKLWIIQNKMLQAGKAHQQLNISSLQPGLYFLKTTINNKQYNQSFLKE